jgi:hypothetical protein
LPLATAYTLVGKGNDGLRARGTTAQAGLQRLALLLGHHAEVDLDRLDARERGQRGGDVAGQLVAQRATGDGQQQLDPDQAAGDREALDHAELGDRPADLGVVDGGEGGLNGLLERGRGS